MKKAIVIFSLLSSSLLMASIIETSSSVFLPASLGKKFDQISSFSAFWWNTLIIREQDVAEKKGEITKICSTVKELKGIRYSKCNESIQAFYDEARQYILDTPYRHPFPSSNKLEYSFKEALSKLSIVPSSQKEIFQLLRLDVVGSSKDLLARLNGQAIGNLPLKNGLFYHHKAGLYFLPILFDYPPGDFLKTQNFVAAINQLGPITFVGVHAGHYDNQKRIMKDVKNISLLIVIILIGVFGLLKSKKLLALLWVFPPILGGIVLASVAVVAIFGKIHALTLAFGPSLCGLAIDYGFHGLLGRDKNKTWNTNLWGLLTTISIFLVLSFSSIPLIRELMIFSSLGLFFSFLLLKYTQKKTSIRLNVSLLGPSKLRAKVLLCLFLSGCLMIPLVASVDFSLKQFDFKKSGDQKIRDDFFQTTNLRPPMVISYENINFFQWLSQSHKIKNWAKSKDIAFEGVSQYLPDEKKLKENLALWQKNCDQLEFWRTRFGKIFSPFFEQFNCQNLANYPPNFDHQSIAFLSHLSSNLGMIDILRPGDAKMEKEILAKFPQAMSFLSLANQFPQILTRDLKRLAPICLMISFLILMVYFKNLRQIGLALIPFLGACGTIGIGFVIFGKTFDFISFVSLLMVCGLSMDYGIFACRAQGEDSIWQAIFCSATTSALGLLPLLFCHHPVLKQFGATLILGVVGAYMGASLCASGFLGRPRVS